MGAGKHNSCKVQIRAVSPDYGLHGHPLICEILKLAGISDASTKSHGNRNSYNVVYATFKALMTHESLEEIALKRGKKLINLQLPEGWLSKKNACQMICLEEPTL